MLVENLPEESAYKSALYESYRVSSETAVLMDLWELQTKKTHPRRNVYKSLRKNEVQAQDRLDHDKALSERRRKAREHNARVLEKRRKRDLEGE